jgi:predicted transcriptional regulator
MKRALRTRLNMYVEFELARRLEGMASARRVSKSAILSAALASFLLPDGHDRREVTIIKRLDRQAQQLDRIERDQNVLVETLALFIRYELSVTASVPEAHQDAVRAQGKARFEKFIAQLARHLQRGGSLVRDLHSEIYPEAEHSGPTNNGSGDGSGSTQ